MPFERKIMDEIRCDVAVIGAGTAGLTAIKAAAGEGATTCLIEAGPGGTTCARVGCMPSKLLISAAEAAHAVAEAGHFGIGTAPPTIDGRRVMARVREHRDRFVAGVLEGIEKNPPTHYLTGHARFSGPRTLLVDDRVRVEARAIVIAVGASPNVPKPFRNLGARLLTNESVFELEDLPDSVAVVGAGPLGLELAQALHRLHVRTTVLDKGGAVGGLSDREVNDAAKALFAEELDLHLSTDIDVRPGDDDVRLEWRSSDGTRRNGNFSRVLVATGRRPALDGLDLQAAGIPLDEHGTPEFDPETLRCGDSAIFIAGDANHDRPLLHEAAWEGKTAGRNAALYPEAEGRRRPVALSVVFTSPQIATVGSFAPDDTRIASGSVDFSDQGRAKVIGQNRGIVRVYGDRESGVLLGAQMACPAAEHFAHMIAWAVEAGIAVREMIELPYYHPTLEEGLRTALRDLCSAMRVAPAVDAPILEYGPGS